MVSLPSSTSAHPRVPPASSCPRRPRAGAAALLASLGLAALGLVAGLHATSAAAQRRPPPRPPQGAPAQTSAEDREARALFEAGVEAFTAARYDRALDYFRRAYELSRRPQLLYNIALSADRLRRDAEALEAFEGYLAAVPDAPEREAAQARIEFLRGASRPSADAAQAAGGPSPGGEPTAAADDGAVAPDGRSRPPEPPDPGRERPRDGGGPGAVPWVLTVGGGALAVAGGVLLVGALVNQGKLADAEDGAEWSRYEGYYDTANVFGGLGWALLGVGAAVAGVGVVLLATGGDRADAAAGRATALALGVGPASLTLRGRF